MNFRERKWLWFLPYRGQLQISADLGLGTILALFVIPLFLSTGCYSTNATSIGGGSAQDVSITDLGSLKVLAKQCDTSLGGGTVLTNGIVIVANQGSQIGAISGTVFYDHDGNDELSESDGVILSFDDKTETLKPEVLFNPRVVHSAPGIGSLMINCIVETVRDGNKETVPILVDLSPIFNVDKK